MKNGYDGFFKKAQQAKGLETGKSPKFNLKAQKPATSKAKAASLSPEDRVRRELADRMRARRQAAKKRRFPTGALASAVAAFVSCAVAYHHSDELDQWLAKIEIGVFGSATAAEAPKPAEAAKTSTKDAAKKEKPAEAKAASSAAETPNIKQWSQEDLSFFSKLNDRKKELDLREAELNKLEEELQKRKAELDEKLKALESTRVEISKTLKTRVATDQTKVDKLVQFYSTMKPAQAAKVIETLNEDLAIEVLDKMKKKSAAEILDMMNAKKARRLSELLTGYQRSVASAADSAEANADASPASQESQKK